MSFSAVVRSARLGALSVPSLLQLSRQRASLWVVGAVLAIVSGCGKDIGDACRTALDCSVSASRLCDTTQPGGYCTVQGCSEGTCPSEAVCVEFRPSLDRLSNSYCMYKCGHDNDCRDGYSCLSAIDKRRHFGSLGDAKILGRVDQKFCAIETRAPVGDADMSEEDAGKP